MFQEVKKIHIYPLTCLPAEPRDLCVAWARLQPAKSETLSWQHQAKSQALIALKLQSFRIHLFQGWHVGWARKGCSPWIHHHTALRDRRTIYIYIYAAAMYIYIEIYSKDPNGCLVEKTMPISHVRTQTDKL